jgi:3-deoxy-D-manno-octulosonic-acid transferase
VIAYSLLYGLALLVLLPLECLKRPPALRRRWLKERLGLVSREHGRLGSSRLWVHAVSVGEVTAAVPFIQAVRKRHPHLEIVLSTVTDTGQAVAGARLGTYATVIYVPFDLPFAVRNAISRIDPSLFLIMETEIWPNTITMMRRASVPVLLLNGRISEKSFNGYRRLVFFLKGVLDCVSLFCMQDETYAGRIRALGAGSDRVKVTGNFKFDTRPSTAAPEWTAGLGRPVIVAGSTHRGEEDVMLNAYGELRREFPCLTLILAPRHPERFAEVAELVAKRGWAYVRRSGLDGAPSSQSGQGAVIILDAMGELASVYGCADAAVIGGSFIEHGGQNPLEPAYWSKPIVCGPHMGNFPFVEEFYAENGAVRAEAGGLAEALGGILCSPDLAASMGRASRRVYDRNAGAVERTLREVERFLPSTAEGAD